MKIITSISFTIFMIFTSCMDMNRQQNESVEIPRINLDHFWHLYEEVTLPNGAVAGIVHIYSEYPDYAFEIEPNEGFTCVDDIARAMMIDEIRFSDDDKLESAYQHMAEFLLYMQAENGYFHNFVWHDLSINKTYRTTLAEPDWWSWRAFWALSNFKSKNIELNNRVKLACETLAENIFETYLQLPEDYDTIEGVVTPNWLPTGTAGDQAAMVIIGLDAYYQNVNKDDRVITLIAKFADGLVKTQKGAKEQFPYGAYMSWRNMWHAYGNSQAYALLRAGQLLKNERFIQSAMLEIDYFYPYLVVEDQISSFSITKIYGAYELTNIQRFPQIAYGLRPLVWACKEAYKVSGDDKYLGQAELFASWYSGKNIAGIKMYDPKTGRCFDGIISDTEANKNSGAESTVEALLALQVLNGIEK